MTPHHHPSEATLVSFAAGALSPEMTAVAATHVEVCRHCREVLANAERIGGLLLGQQLPAGPDAAQMARQRGAMLDRLDESTSGISAATIDSHAVATRRADPECLPFPLQVYFGRSWSALRWRWIAPGVHMIRAVHSDRDTLILLKIAPGRSVPVHSHRGTELTQILRGAYDDALGHFGPGDAADLDDETEHQPITAPGSPCICVAAMDAPLRFPGWLAGKLQPLIRI